MLQLIKIRQKDGLYERQVAKQIESGENGIDNLDFKNLAENLIETELLKKN